MDNAKAPMLDSVALAVTWLVCALVQATSNAAWAQCLLLIGKYFKYKIPSLYTPVFSSVLIHQNMLSQSPFSHLSAIKSLSLSPQSNNNNY
jgi:hypothetical protein